MIEHGSPVACPGRADPLLLGQRSEPLGDRPLGDEVVDFWLGVGIMVVWTVRLR